MNLSQILNPPGPSSSPLPPASSHSHRQGRASSPPLSTAGMPSPPLLSTTPSLASVTNVIRFGSTPSGLSGSPSKKHPNSVSVARLEEETMTTSSGGNTTAGNYTNKLNITSSSTSSSTGGSHQKIKPNETNAVYSTHTFRANGPFQVAKEKTSPVPITTATATLALPQNAAAKTTATATAAGGGGAGGTGSRGTGNQLVMRSNTMQPMPSSASAAKKKPRIQGSSAPESSTFQDSFQSSPSTEPRTTTAKKKPAKKASDIDIQQHPLEIRFVMTEKDGQGRLKNRKQPLSPPPQTLSPSQDTQGDTAADQEAQESSPTPDFERNADGKFRCSWPRCGKEFTVASRLTTHFRIHSGKPPYLCGYKDCQKAFHTSSSLSHHRVVHTDQSLRPYVCRHNRCGATYTQLARLITHQRTTHSGMILFIPQESSSSSSTSSSPSHPQNQFHQYVPPTTATTPTGSNQEAHTPPSQSPTLAANTPGAAAATTTVAEVPDTCQQEAPPPATPPAGDTAIEDDIPLHSIAGTRSEGQRDETATRAAVDNDDSQQGTRPLSTRASMTSVGNADPSGRQSQDPQENLSEEQSRTTYAPETKREDSPEAEQDFEEDEESDEMRQRKEAALTMASFRDLAMLQNQRQDGHSGPTSAQHHVHPAQASYPSQGQHYSSSEYRPSHRHQHQHNHRHPSSHREYPPDAYQQHHQHSNSAPHTSSAYEPSSGPPPMNGSHTYDAHHGEAHSKEAQWKPGHARVGSDQYESESYIRHGQIQAPSQQGQESLPTDHRYYDARQTSRHYYAQPSHGQQHSRRGSYSEQRSQ